MWSFDVPHSFDSGKALHSGKVADSTETGIRQHRQGVPSAQCVEPSVSGHGKGNSNLSWRKACQTRHLVDVLDSDQ